MFNGCVVLRCGIQQPLNYIKVHRQATQNAHLLLFIDIPTCGKAYMKLKHNILIAFLCLCTLSCSSTQSIHTSKKIRHQESLRTFEEGKLHLEEGNYEKAVNAFLESVKLDESNAFAHESLGWAYFSLMQNKKASEEFNRAIALNPNCKEAHQGIGYMHFMSSHYNKAIDSFRQVIEIDPAFAPAHAALGRAYHKKGLIDQAIYELELSIKLDRREVMSYYILAEIYEKKGLPDKAETYRTRMHDTYRQMPTPKKTMKKRMQ
jgi:tetratricopeptide (TPR) repeat protein